MPTSMISRAMWQTEEILHGKNGAALPATLLGVSTILLLYKHMSEDDEAHIKTFLALILVQKIPLVLLEVKILACADPVGLLCKFGSHVILMHAAFLGLRAVGLFYRHYFWALEALNVEFLVTATLLFLSLVTLSKGFNLRLSFRSMLQHYDVFGLVGLAIMVAYAQTLASELLRPDTWMPHTGPLVLSTISDATDYIEILSFVPAVWMVYKEDKNVQDVPKVTVESAETKRLAVSFFAFLVLLYSKEDVLAAYDIMNLWPLAAAAHMVHFFLLLDFSFFILAHIFNPEKLLNIRRELGALV